MVGVVVREFHADDARELVRGRITLLDICVQFFVCLVFTPVLLAQNGKDIFAGPVCFAFGAMAMVIHNCFFVI
jgi:hypothetical protein